MTTRNTARNGWSAAATCALLLLAVRCDCGGALVDGDAGQRVDAQVDAAILDLAALDAVATDQAVSDLPGADLLAPDGAGADARPVDGNSIDGNTGDASAVEAGRPDHGVADAAGTDASPLDTSASSDGGAGDAASADQAPLLGDASADVGPLPDAASASDGAPADSGAVDTGAADAAAAQDSGSPTGLSVPCQNGPGWTLFRFHYDGSYSARLDVWDASCDYSLAPGSACNVVPVRTETLVHDDSALLISNTSYIRVRFDVGGLSFSQAAVYVQARSYSTGSSTGIEVWSPLYGSVFGGPVDNDWVFDWYGMDWTGYLYPDDDPDLTAIQIYAYQGSGSLAVHAVELCVE